MTLSSQLKGDGGVGLALLRSAAEDVLSAWTREAEQLLHGTDEVDRIVGELVDAVERFRAEDDPAVFVGEIQDRHLYHRLLQDLRFRLLRLWRDGKSSFSDADGTEILEVFYCLERIRSELWPGGEEDLALRLSGPDTFELLVEVAHDMRSPLSSILFLSETLRASRSGEVNELQRRQLGLIYGAALGLMSIANDVVDAAKKGSGLMDEEPTQFSLGEVFESTREMVRPVAEEKGLDLEFKRPDQDYLHGHPMVLSRVLLNLTTNALKFTEEGSVTVSAKRIDRKTLEFAVEDTGRGMSETEIKKLFRPFRKSEYRSGHFFSNTGLGLSITRRLLAGLDSALRVDSEVGRGTRFSFRLELPAVTSP